MKVVAQNKKIFYDYEITETLEAGIVLTGDEVKALRAGQASLIGAFANIHRGELFLVNCQITPYVHAYAKHEDANRRSRKLLVHKRELARLMADLSRKGVTILPLKIYFNQQQKVKVQLGLGKHKKAREQKEAIKERDIARQTRRELKDVYKY